MSAFRQFANRIQWRPPAIRPVSGSFEKKFCARYTSIAPSASKSANPIPNASRIGNIVMSSVISGRDPSTQILEVKGGGVALIDHDGDGDLDVFVPNGATLASPGEGPGCRLFDNCVHRA